jgi:ABC-type Mn2+/Zn2+ transport system permease subunit
MAMSPPSGHLHLLLIASLLLVNRLEYQMMSIFGGFWSFLQILLWDNCVCFFIDPSFVPGQILPNKMLDFLDAPVPFIVSPN